MNAAVYPVPDVRTGDQVMAALELDGRHGGGGELFGRDFAAFLAGQPDLGTKWAPRYVRLVAAMPLTGTNKIDRELLRRSAWGCVDGVWWRPERDGPYVTMTLADMETLGRQFDAHGRRALQPGVGPRGLRN